MKVEKPELIIHINLPKNFINLVKETMEDEIDISTKKWGVNLNTDDRKLVIKHSLNQLQRKVAESARTVWDLSDTLNVRVSCTKNSGELTLPNPSLKLSSKLSKTKDGWKIEEEDIRDDVVPLINFDKHFEKLIFTWARTAVFYGVGSYTQ